MEAFPTHATVGQRIGLELNRPACRDPGLGAITRATTSLPENLPGGSTPSAQSTRVYGVNASKGDTDEWPCHQPTAVYGFYKQKKMERVLVDIDLFESLQGRWKGWLSHVPIHTRVNLTKTTASGFVQRVWSSRDRVLIHHRTTTGSHAFF